MVDRTAELCSQIDQDKSAIVAEILSELCTVKEDVPRTIDTFGEALDEANVRIPRGRIPGQWRDDWQAGQTEFESPLPSGAPVELPEKGTEVTEDQVECRTKGAFQKQLDRLERLDQLESFVC